MFWKDGWARDGVDTNAVGDQYVGMGKSTGGSIRLTVSVWWDWWESRTSSVLGRCGTKSLFYINRILRRVRK